MDVVAFARILGLSATLLEQDGVIRRDQAMAAGLTRHRVDGLVKRGRWVRVLPQVYASADVFGQLPPTAAPPLRRLPPRSRVRAVWLWAGPGAVIAGEAAAWWWDLLPRLPALITVIVPPSRALTKRPGVRIIRALVDRRDTRDENWIRVTSPSRTCLDLARSANPDRLADALRLRKVSHAELGLSLDRSRGRRGQARARAAVQEVRTNPWSEAERAAHLALRDAGVSGWVANPREHLSTGARYPDIAFEDAKLAVEIDGRTYHDTAEAFDHDRARHNEFVHAGWVVLHFTRDQVMRDPQGFVAGVEAMLTTLRAGRRRDD